MSPRKTKQKGKPMNKSLTKGVLFSLGIASLAAIFSGCAGAQRSAPNAVPVLDMSLQRSDYILMENVEERSEVTSILNIVHVIDNDPEKMIIFGYRTFEDQYELTEADGVIDGALSWISELFSGGSPVARANYKALTAAETLGADVIVPKRVQTTITGFRPFFTVRTATVKGKAAQIKNDAAGMTR